jgi:regulatory protein YycH of two-component signal transduction system YycFG
MKYDIKNVLLGILILLSAFFFYKWYFSSDTVAIVENKKLEIENKKLEKERRDIDRVNDSLSIHYKSIEAEITKTSKGIDILKGNFIELQNDVRKYNDELVTNQVVISELQKRIDYLIDNPTKRTGDDLIRSLDEKINRKK